MKRVMNGRPCKLAMCRHVLGQEARYLITEMPEDISEPGEDICLSDSSSTQLYSYVIWRPRRMDVLNLAMHEVYASKKNECEIACMSARVLSGRESASFAKGTASPNF